MTPAARKSPRPSVVTVPGFASSVISASGATPNARAIASSTRPIASAENNDGVPPPRYTVATRRPANGGSAAHASISRTSVAV